MFCLLAAVLAQGALAQQTSKVTLDTNETIFTILTAMNACGYDNEVGASLPIRSQIREEVTRALQSSPAAAEAAGSTCSFYRDHRQSDPARTFSQYVSLALNLNDPASFKPRTKEADMPPDTQYVLGFASLLPNFYEAVGIHRIWEEHKRDYEGLIEKFSEPISNLLLATDVYLKMPLSGYVGREFVIYIDPMAAPGEVNARNYGDNYFMVVSPSQNGLRVDTIRHTYLHFVLDPLALKRANAMKRMQPILREISNAPLDDSYKSDASLLVTESLIKAIEAHLIAGKGPGVEETRQRQVNADMADGFVLTQYFYGVLTKFQTEPTSLKDAFGDWLYYLDVDRERKRASQIRFSSKPAPEVLSTAKTRTPDPLDTAEQKLGEGDLAGAQQLAQQVIDNKGPETGRAYFILGQTSTLNKNIEDAMNYFELALQNSQEPRLIAWSHIYLGRIYDVQEERDAAVKHYKAALDSGDSAPETRSAAERGLKEAYKPRKTADAKQDDGNQ